VVVNIFEFVSDHSLSELNQAPFCLAGAQFDSLT